MSSQIALQSRIKTDVTSTVVSILDVSMATTESRAMIKQEMVLHGDDHEKRHNSSNNLAGEFLQALTMLQRRSLSYPRRRESDACKIQTGDAVRYLAESGTPNPRDTAGFLLSPSKAPRGHLFMKSRSFGHD